MYCTHWQINDDDDDDDDENFGNTINGCICRTLMGSVNRQDVRSLMHSAHWEKGRGVS